MPSVVKRIREYNEALPAQLQNLKWNALIESPFRFYRGTCHLFAADFKKMYGYKNIVKTWTCGDAHFENFGFYKGESRLVYFDLNDFDEAILSSPQAEIARLLTSVVIAAQQMNVPDSAILKALQNLMAAYANALHTGKALMTERETATGLIKKYFDKIAARDRAAFIAKHTVKHKGNIFLKQDGVHFLPIGDKTKEKIYTGIKYLLKHNKQFAHMQFEDAAFRIAGTGSLGLQRYCILCFNKENDKHYLIDIKESRESCHKPMLRIRQPRFKNESERIIYAGNLLQFSAPDFQAPVKIDKRWFIVKELQPVTDKLIVADFKNDFAAFEKAAHSLAPILAYAQLRSSGHGGAATADELMRFATRRQWQKEVIALSIKLAEKNNQYYNTFLKSAKVKDRILLSDGH